MSREGMAFVVSRVELRIFPLYRGKYITGILPAVSAPFPIAVPVTARPGTAVSTRSAL
jgi:hypothetical protein